MRKFMFTRGAPLKQRFLYFLEGSLKIFVNQKALRLIKMRRTPERIALLGDVCVRRK
jgi:hypothetical protein